jgi:alpha-1,3-mannosyltransferase
MLIVHVVRQFHPGVGGLETVVLELAKAQAEAGNRVRVVTLDRLFNDPTRERLPGRETLAGIEIERIPYFGSVRYPVAPSVLRHIRDADLVHVHAIDFLFDYLAWTRPLHGRRLVVSTHGGFFHTQYAALIKRVWFQTVTRLSLRAYAGTAAVSAYDFERFSSIQTRGLVCIENGVNVSTFLEASAPSLRKSIISVGRFAENKRIDRLIAFIGALRRHDPDWTLTLAGRANDLQVEQINALVEKHGLGTAIKIVVSPTDQTIKALMGGTSFFASASEYEGFGIAAIEALSAGLMPVLSDIPPFRWLVARTGIGIILDFADPDDAAHRFLTVSQERSPRYAELRAECMRAANIYAWPLVCAEYAKFYDAAIGATERTILDVPVQVRSFENAVDLLDQHYAKGERLAVAFANAHTLNVAANNPDFRVALQNSLVLNDGIGVDIASRLLYGSRFPENLNGTDFTPNYLRATKNCYRIFLLGSQPGIAERAARRLSALYLQHTIAGCYHGHFDAEQLQEVIKLIRRSRADVLLVAMGNPKQELFIRDHLSETGCLIGIGVGALFDFLAGEVPRAMPWVQRWRLEWLYRLTHEPRRLAGRYLVGIPLFLARISRQWLSGARVRGAAPIVDRNAASSS